MILSTLKMVLPDNALEGGTGRAGLGVLCALVGLESSGLSSSLDAAPSRAKNLQEKNEQLKQEVHLKGILSEVVTSWYVLRFFDFHYTFGRISLRQV
jgi:hypothetical protein